MADGRQRKKVRIANEAGSHQIGGRPVANIPEATRNKLRGILRNSASPKKKSPWKQGKNSMV
jgi:hypothetical protein